MFSWRAHAALTACGVGLVQETLSRISRVDYVMPPHLSPAAADLIARCACGCTQKGNGVGASRREMRARGCLCACLRSYAVGEGGAQEGGLHGGLRGPHAGGNTGGGLHAWGRSRRLARSPAFRPLPPPPLAPSPHRPAFACASFPPCRCPGRVLNDPRSCPFGDVHPRLRHRSDNLNSAWGERPVCASLAPAVCCEQAPFFWV